MKFSHWWLGLPGLIYDIGKHSGSKKNNAAAPAATTEKEETEESKVKNVYNYNYLDDSNTGNTLFNSKQKTRRTVFGAE